MNTTEQPHSPNNPIATNLSEEERRQLRLQRAREAGVLHNLNVVRERLKSEEKEVPADSAIYSPWWGFAGYLIGFVSAVVLYKVGHQLLWKLSGRAAQDALVETAVTIDQAVASTIPAASKTTLSPAAIDLLRKANIKLPSLP